MFLVKKIIPYALTIGLLLTVAGCSDNGTDPGSDFDFDASAILQNEANGVILQTYLNLDAEAADLVSAVTELENNTTEANLEAARQQWRNTRKPWENSEGFLFGPVDDEGIDPAIDSWPLNQTDLENVLAGNDELTVEFVTGLGNGLKGFHTIEFLLFGEANSKTVGDFTAREFAYLTSATQSLKNETARLVNGWEPGGGNFVSTLVDGSNEYPSQRSAVEQLIEGMDIIAFEVANGKIGGPLSEQNPNIVESQFSFNSKVDFQNNIRSIRSIYTGDYQENDGPGITDFVVEFDADLDARFKQEIEAAITAIANIEGNFRDAITENPEDVENAQQAVQTVLATIQQDIRPLLNELN